MAECMSEKYVQGSNGEWVHREDVLGDRVATDQVLLDDALQHLRGAVVIPHSLRVYDRYRPLLANPEAVDLGAVDPLGTLEQAEVRQALLEVVPGGQRRLAGRALGLGLVGAEEDVPAKLADVEVGGDGGQTSGVVRHYSALR